MSDLNKAVRQPDTETLPDRETILRRWDTWQKRIAADKDVSWARHEFETLLAAYDEEIERLQALLDGDFKKSAELSLKRAEYPDADGALRLDLQATIIPLIAEHLAEIFTREGGKNYLGIEFNHPELGPLTLNIQRRFGETPAAKAMRLEAENNELRRQIEERSDTASLSNETEA